MRIPRSLRDLQAGWESRLFDFSTPRLFHGLSLLLCDRCQELSLRVVVSDTVCSDRQCDGCIQMLVHDHLAAGHGASPDGRLDLQDEVVKADGVIPVDGSFETLREDQVEVFARATQECGATLRSRNLEPAIELDDVMLGKKCVGRFQVSDCAQSQLLGEPSLPGRKASLRASPRLG